jgi:ADP-glucose pyrophosphorylase
MSIDVPLRKLTVAAGRETIGFITEYSKRRFAAHLASGEQVGAFFRSSADAAQALSNAKGTQAPSSKGGAK